MATKKSELKKLNITGPKGLAHPAAHLKEREKELGDDLQKLDLTGPKGITHPSAHW